MARPRFDYPGEHDRLMRYQDQLNDEFPGYVVRVVDDTQISAIKLGKRRRGPDASGPYEVLVELTTPTLPTRRLRRMARWIRLLIKNGPDWSIKTDYTGDTLVVYGRTWFGTNRTPPLVRVERCTPERAERELALLALAGAPETTR